MAATLVSFATLKTFLGLTKNEIDYPDLTIIQASVVAAIENYCDREFESTSRNFSKLIEYETDKIEVKAYPVSTVSSVTIDGVAQTVTTDYLKIERGILLASPICYNTVAFTYTGGLATIPKDLERAALLQTAYEYQRKDSIGLQTVSSDGGSITKEPELGLLKEVKQLLRLYVNQSKNLNF